MCVCVFLGSSTASTLTGVKETAHLETTASIGMVGIECGCPTLNFVNANHSDSKPNNMQNYPWLYVHSCQCGLSMCSPPLKACMAWIQRLLGCTVHVIMSIKLFRLLRVQ